MPSPPEVLWAEDDPRDQFLIRASLDEMTEAPRIEFANDGVHLLAALERVTPRLVVLDLRMPRMDGLATLTRIRAQESTRKLRVIIFSSGNVAPEVAACRALGVDDVLQKPIEFTAFQAIVQRIAAAAGPVPIPKDGKRSKS